jgi:uncharacterized protein
MSFLIKWHCYRIEDFKRAESSLYQQDEHLRNRAMALEFAAYPNISPGMNRNVSPLITSKVHEAMRAALKSGASTMECSLDLERTRTFVELAAVSWKVGDSSFPYLDKCKERTIYYWSGKAFEPVARYTTSLIKLVPTQWGAPTFEIDGIKMLPTLHVSPYEDARSKVASIQPEGKVILDTCGGLGYFAAWCLKMNARHVLSFEKNPDVVWLRNLNPWSPEADRGAQAGDSNARAATHSLQSQAANPKLALMQADVVEHIAAQSDASFDAVLHDPPRFGIAGDLYSQAFYGELSRVLKRRGKLFHYTGTPNKLTSGRDVPAEVTQRLQRAGFSVVLQGDGLLGTKR